MYFVFLADGFEEMEALAPVDILRRAELEVATVGIGSKYVSSSHGVMVATDIMDCELSYDKDIVDGIILPGGMPGTLNLEKSKLVQEFIDKAYADKKLIGAICAAPSILGHKGLLKGKNAVCYTGFEEQLLGANICNKAVAVDENIITGCGAGASIEFSLALVEYINNKADANRLKGSLLCDR